MFKSEEGQRLTKQFLFFLILIIILSTVLYTITIKKYEEALLIKEANIAAVLIKKYPEEESIIIETLKENIFSPEEAKTLLEQYGINSDTTSFKEEKNLLIGVYFFTLLITIVSITLLYIYNMNKFYKKIDGISDYIKKVLNHKTTPKMKDYYEGSFSTLRNDVYKITNRLMEQNEDIMKDKKYLEETLSDISHQLKTPLTSLYMINNCLMDEKIDEETKAKFLEENQKQLERIEWLVTSLLKLSRLESGMIKFKVESIKVSHLLEEAISALAIPIELKHQKLSYKGNLNIKVQCDVKWTVEALVNIIKNAHEHTKDSGTIFFTWQDNPLYVAISIQDNGEGIDAKDLPHIFERFYKGSHNSKESIGIGLNMAKQILEREKGEITVISEKGKGTTFTLKFYKTDCF